jgi:hypothetical protein
MFVQNASTHVLHLPSRPQGSCKICVGGNGSTHIQTCFCYKLISSYRARREPKTYTFTVYQVFKVNITRNSEQNLKSTFLLPRFLVQHICCCLYCFILFPK